MFPDRGFMGCFLCTWPSSTGFLTAVESYSPQVSNLMHAHLQNWSHSKITLKYQKRDFS